MGRVKKKEMGKICYSEKDKTTCAKAQGPERSCWVKGSINYKYINKRLGQMGMREKFRKRSQPDPDSFRVTLRGLRSIKAKRIN